MVISVDVDIDKTGNLGPKTRQAITKYLKKGADKGMAVSMDHVPVDRGAGGGLLSGFFEPEEVGDRVMWGIRDMPHARPIDEGTDPFYPPIEPLLEWSQRVAGDEGLGWYVARHKIPEEGITAQPYIDPGVEAQINWYRSHDIDEFLRRELD